MTKVRTILVEDEEASLYLLKEALYPYQNIEIVAEFRNGIEGLEGINSLQPDLVFVDIEIPGMNGFQMLQNLSCSPIIIFCTGHEKYALEAWNYKATDFITKPIDQKRFATALEKALTDLENKVQEKRLSHQRLFAGLIEFHWQDAQGKKSRYFSPSEILYFQGDRDYLRIYLEPEIVRELGLFENFITIKQTVKETIKQLDKHGFLQVHKSYLINMAKILEWNRSHKEIRLHSSDAVIPVGRAFMKAFQEKWQS